MNDLTIEEQDQVKFLAWLSRYEYSFEPSDYEDVVREYTEYKRKKYEYGNKVRT